MQDVQDSIRRLIETPLSDGVHCTHGSCVADLLYKFKLIIGNNLYSTQSGLFKFQSDA